MAMTLVGPELIMARRQIRAMIQADPISVTLSRRTKTKTAANGWVWSSPTALAAQTCRLIPFGMRVTQFLLNTDLGKLPQLPYLLLGPAGMDAKRGDTFVFNGDNFELVTEDIGEPEVKCLYQVDYWGGENNGL
jgi:hypothetical protein